MCINQILSPLIIVTPKIVTLTKIVKLFWAKSFGPNESVTNLGREGSEILHFPKQSHITQIVKLNKIVTQCRLQENVTFMSGDSISLWHGEARIFLLNDIVR